MRKVSVNGAVFLTADGTLRRGSVENGEPEGLPQRYAKKRRKNEGETTGIHHRGMMDTEFFRMDQPRNARKPEGGLKKGRKGPEMRLLRETGK